MNRRKGVVDIVDDDDNDEVGDKNRFGVRVCCIVKFFVYEDVVVYLLVVELGLCLLCSKDKVCVILVNNIILRFVFYYLMFLMGILVNFRYFGDFVYYKNKIFVFI